MKRTLRDRLGIVAFFAVLLGFLALFIALLAPFATPLVCALSVAIFLWPVHRWVARLLPRQGRSFRAFLSASGVLVLLVAPVIVISISASNEAVALWPTVSQKLIAMKKRFADPAEASAAWTKRLPFGLGPRVQESLAQSQDKLVSLGDRAAGYAAGTVASLAVNLLLLLGNIFLFEFVLFFLLRDGETLLKQWKELLPFPEELTRRIHKKAEGVIQGVFRGIVVVGLAQTAILSIAYLVIDVHGFVLLSALTAVATLLPGIGVGIVWIPLVIIYLIKGIFWKAITLIVFGVITGTVDNILRPLVAGSSMDLPVLWFFLALMGGVQFFGTLGILLGPMIFALLPILLDTYRVYLDPSD